MNFLDFGHVSYNNSITSLIKLVHKYLKDKNYLIVKDRFN